MGGHERDVVERSVAQLPVTVARTPRGRRGRGAAAAEERADDDRDHQSRDPHRCELPAESQPRVPQRLARLLLLPGPVHQPEDRAHALVDQVDAKRAHQESEDGVSLDEHHHSGCREGHSAQHPQHGTPRLRCKPAAGHAQWLAEGTRLDQRRRRGRHHHAARGEYPGGGAKVAQEGVPDRPRCRLLVRPVDVVHRERARDGVRHHEQHARDGHRHAELDDRLSPVRREEQRPRHQYEGEDEQQHREQLDALGDVGERCAEAAYVPLDQLDPLSRLELAGELGTHLLERGRQHRPDIGDRERDGVLVALEERAVHISDGLPEQVRERAASDDVGRHRLDDRPGRDQIGLVLQDHLVGELLRDERAHAVVAQRHGGSVGELVRVHGGVARVGRHERKHDCHRGQNHEHPRRELTRVHVPNVQPAG